MVVEWVNLAELKMTPSRCLDFVLNFSFFVDLQ